MERRGKKERAEQQRGEPMVQWSRRVQARWSYGGVTVFRDEEGAWAFSRQFDGLMDRVRYGARVTTPSLLVLFLAFLTKDGFFRKLDTKIKVKERALGCSSASNVKERVRCDLRGRRMRERNDASGVDMPELSPKARALDAGKRQRL
ncbi:hypothetical protein U1Q18_036040 [Sarracenia purpurea var. burkii]